MNVNVLVLMTSFKQLIQNKLPFSAEFLDIEWSVNCIFNSVYVPHYTLKLHCKECSECILQYLYRDIYLCSALKMPLQHNYSLHLNTITTQAVCRKLFLAQPVTPKPQRSNVFLLKNCCEVVKALQSL